MDWDKLGFQVIPTDFMYIMKSNEEGTFSNGDLVPFGTVQIEPHSTVLNYGQVSYCFFIHKLNIQFSGMKRKKLERERKRWRKSFFFFYYLKFCLKLKQEKETKHLTKEKDTKLPPHMENAKIRVMIAFDSCLAFKCTFFFFFKCILSIHSIKILKKMSCQIYV